MSIWRQTDHTAGRQCINDLGPDCDLDMTVSLLCRHQDFTAVLKSVQRSRIDSHCGCRVDDAQTHRFDIGELISDFEVTIANDYPKMAATCELGRFAAGPGMAQFR